MITIKDMNILVDRYGGKCISNIYLNQNVKLRWQCKKGHIWEAPSKRIKEGHWCPNCAGIIKLTLKDMEILAKGHNGECLSDRYVDRRQNKLRWQCKENHIWEATYRMAKDHWCPTCNKLQVFELRLEEMKEIAISRGGKCLSEITDYKGDQSVQGPRQYIKLKWQCGKGHIWESATVKYGSWCLICAGKKKLTIEDMRKIAADKGGKCLSKKYVNALTKLLWQCKEGHIWKASPNDIRDHWCLVCSGSKKKTITQMKALALSNNGKCLSRKYHGIQIKLKWSCSKGHKFWMRPGSIIQQGSWCPECSFSKSEKYCREAFEELFNEKFPKSKPKWLKNPKTGHLLELDGYCVKLGIAFEHNGLQHYQLTEKFDKFHMTEEGFERLKFRDQIKKQLCEEHGILLIVIPQIGVKINKQASVTKSNLRKYIMDEYQKRREKW